ncbi:MAG: cell envelope integrity protein CreD [Ahrensia sp.]|nr:cell envelope integrity protein CreD [Ahrensia sp.]
MVDETQKSQEDENEAQPRGTIENPWPRSMPRSYGSITANKSLGYKFFLLGMLAVLLYIPLLMVWGLVTDRERNYRAATAEIGKQWGADQTIGGPLIAVPVILQRDFLQDGKTVFESFEKIVLFAPNTMSIDSTADTSRRVRGIHEAIVYTTSAKISARFKKPNFANLAPSIIRADWTRARLILTISDLKGIEKVNIKMDGKPGVEVEPGYGLEGANINVAYDTSNGSGYQFGLHAPIDGTAAFMEGKDDVVFDVDLTFKGSQSLNFIPVGETTEVKLSSPWLHPSFAGTFLPTQRDITKDGFSANWSVSKLARSNPQIDFASSNSLNAFHTSSFGVRFYEPIDFYRLVDRAVKYGVLFIGMVFLMIFSTEILSKGRMHVVHYTMAGLMVIMFYVLLLAIAEVAGFTIAYAIAAGATGAVLAGFVASVFRGRKATVLAFGGFSVLYGLLYLVLSLEDAALLAGAITGFVILTSMMFATRSVDWSGTNKNSSNNNEPL